MGRVQEGPLGVRRDRGRDFRQSGEAPFLRPCDSGEGGLQAGDSRRSRGVSQHGLPEVLQGDHFQRPVAPIVPVLERHHRPHREDRGLPLHGHAIRRVRHHEVHDLPRDAERRVLQRGNLCSFQDHGFRRDDGRSRSGRPVGLHVLQVQPLRRDDAHPSRGLVRDYQRHRPRAHRRRRTGRGVQHGQDGLSRPPHRGRFLR